MQVKKQQLELDMEQQTGSKSGKENIKAVYITFLFSAAGVKIGSVFGAKNKKYAELLGGVVLMLIGLKILLEHLEVISF